MKQYRVFSVIPVLALLFLMNISKEAQALESDWAAADYVQARLLAGAWQENTEDIDAEDDPDEDKATAGTGYYLAAFEIRLSPEWHAYWRMPGEGGLPPRFNWDESSNIADIAISWPVPKRFETMGLYSFGYSDHVILPLKITPEHKKRDVAIDVTADIMVCRDICVPQTVSLALDIPAGGPAKDMHMPIINDVLENLPREGNKPGLKIENVVIGPQAVVVNAYAQNGFKADGRDTDLFIETGSDIYVTALPEMTVNEDDPRKAMIRVAAPPDIDNLAGYLSGGTVRLTLVHDDEAIEKTVSLTD